MNRSEAAVGAVTVAIGVFFGVRISLSLWQVTIGAFADALPLFDPVSLLNDFLITWILSVAGIAILVDGLRRIPQLPTVNALTLMPES
jgi:uncharacterized membrane protein YqgA involved in biofilm formation